MSGSSREDRFHPALTRNCCPGVCPGKPDLSPACTFFDTLADRGAAWLLTPSSRYRRGCFLGGAAVLRRISERRRSGPARKASAQRTGDRQHRRRQGQDDGGAWARDASVGPRHARLRHPVHQRNNKPPHLHLIITGRGAPAELIDYADLVTEMAEVKHPYRSGIPGQPGIEY